MGRLNYHAPITNSKKKKGGGDAMKFLNHLARVVTNLKPTSTATYDRTPAPTPPL